MNSVLHPLRSAELDAALATLDRVIAESAAEALPALVTALAARTTAASSRLVSGGAPRGDEPEDRNLDISEAAARLGVSTSWLYRNHGKIPCSIRLGRRLLFSARGLERWNQQRQQRGR